VGGALDVVDAPAGEGRGGVRGRRHGEGDGQRRRQNGRERPGRPERARCSCVRHPYSTIV
jgi:hypothetical protein